MNNIHVTQAEGSKERVTNSFADACEDLIIQAVAAGKNGKLNGDNLDLRVTTNDIRMSNKGQDYHFFASDWVVDRVNLQGLDDKKPLGDINSAPVDVFLPSAEETAVFKDALKVHMARKISAHIKSFGWMKIVIPSHIHTCQVYRFWR